nr:hypothetical protein BaRGS_006144 [Batillaria attramentaria]
MRLRALVYPSDGIKGTSPHAAVLVAVCVQEEPDGTLTRLDNFRCPDPTPETEMPCNVIYCPSRKVGPDGKQNRKKKKKKEEEEEKKKEKEEEKKKKKNKR